MHAIRPASPADEAAAVDLVVRLQADPAHHIGYHGVTAVEVAAELAGLAPDWASGAVVAADRDGRLRGVLSVEADPEVGRAWLHGPFVDVPASHPAAAASWHGTADKLFARALDVPRLAGITDLELYGHRRNRLLADFAARHGFERGAASRVFTLSGTRLRAVLVQDADAPQVSGTELLGADPGLRAKVVALHEQSFPNRTVTGRQLVDGDRGHAVVVLRAGSAVVGYAAGFAQPDELYVDYVAVDPNLRSAGAGRALVLALLRALAAEHGARSQAAAVVALGNDPSERMFTALGFDLHLELVGYRRTAAPVTGR